MTPSSCPSPLSTVTLTVGSPPGAEVGRSRRDGDAPCTKAMGSRWRGLGWPLQSTPSSLVVGGRRYATPSSGGVPFTSGLASPQLWGFSGSRLPLPSVVYEGQATLGEAGRVLQGHLSRGHLVPSLESYRRNLQKRRKGPGGVAGAGYGSGFGRRVKLMDTSS